MRKSVLAGLGAGGLLLAGGAVGVGYHWQWRAPPPIAAEAPPPPFAARELARATAGVDLDEGEAAAAAPSAPAVPDLPTVEIAPRPVHTVPEDEPPPAPKANPFVQAARPTASSEASSRPAPSPTPPVIAGAAKASGPTTLAVAGRPIRLFGVKTPEPGDRCGTGSGRGNCAEAAHDALTQRLDRSPQVSCRIPAGQRGNPAAVCVDASGTDLGRFLVAEGLALADTTQSYEYFGAEGKARSSRVGLWGHR
jgi:endonuclease YncB( thermonuclease family)